MAISLPKALRTLLVSNIAQCLAETTVENGSFLSLPTQMWRLHELVRAGSQTAQELERYLGDQHVSTFVTKELWKIAPHNWEPDAPPEPFEAKFGKAAPLEWAEDLVTRLQSLPWRYAAYTPFPGDLTAGLLEGAPVPLTNSMRLVTGELLESITPIKKQPGLRNLLKEGTGFEWQPHQVYIETEFEGYIPVGGDSESAHHLMHLTLSLYGIALALGLLIEDRWRTRTHRPPFYAHYVFSSENQTKSHVSNVGFDPSHVKTFEELGNFTTLSIAPAPRTSFQQKAAEIGKVMSMSRPRLLNAARWYLDSHSGLSDQVRFVQICTALEVLLGDEKQGRETGLTSLMANRCAYLLGKNEQDRQNIIAGFKDGYDIRSKIVHAGKNKLSGADKAHFFYMQRLCAAIIRKECSEIL
ncbi:TPA: hypothetical protein UM343_000816 [Stenotrophomonas maltophilia]|nr:hypothetical protein [Stenotrophomonas maltophilia]